MLLCERWIPNFIDCERIHLKAIQGSMISMPFPARKPISHKTCRVDRELTILIWSPDRRMKGKKPIREGQKSYRRFELSQSLTCLSRAGESGSANHSDCTLLSSSWGGTKVEVWEERLGREVWGKLFEGRDTKKSHRPAGSEVCRVHYQKSTS